MGNPATLESEAPTKMLGQKTFLRWVLILKGILNQKVVAMQGVDKYL
jgi:hypothetical protein